MDGFGSFFRVNNLEFDYLWHYASFGQVYAIFNFFLFKIYNF